MNHECTLVSSYIPIGYTYLVTCYLGTSDDQIFSYTLLIKYRNQWLNINRFIHNIIMLTLSGHLGKIHKKNLHEPQIPRY